MRLRGGEAELAEVVRALDAEQIAIEHLQLHVPSLDDVFLAKTGRSLEGADEAGEAASINPVTALLEAGRGFISGDPVSVALAFAVAVVLPVLFAVWAQGGLRRAEAAG